MVQSSKQVDFLGQSGSVPTLPFTALLTFLFFYRRILLFPHGNNIDQCSIYLEHGFEADEVPDNWSCCVQFALVLWNPNDPSLYIHHTAHHRFTKEEGDWGFTRFVEHRRMFNVPWEGGSRPLCENDTANITAYVRLVEDETGVLWHNFANYDSKKETGYVGLKNQGATCYLNSLMQSLYFTNKFRKVISIFECASVIFC
jgi:ubiquitin carboxyl-terminal hydrolase 7